MSAADAWSWQRSTSDADLEEENARLRAVLGHCPKCIGVADVDGRLVGYNKEFASLFSSPALGTPLEDLFEERHRPMVAQVLAQAGTSQRAAAVLPLTTTDGDEREIEFLVATLPGDPGSSSIGVVMGADDHSHRAREESERFALIRQIDDANRGGAISLAQATLCHDVNNALTTASLGLGALRMLPTLRDGAALEMLTSTIEAVNHVMELTARASRASQSRLVPQRGAARVGASLTQALRILSQEAKRKRIALEVEASVDAVVGLSETELTQVLTNLVSNAMHAIEDAKRLGAVRIHVTRAGPNVRTSIIDNGNGIEPSRLLDSFEAFETTRAEQGGTGLGLALARSLVTGVEGRIDVLSSPGVGTEMVVELPEVQAAESAGVGQRSQSA